MQRRYDLDWLRVFAFALLMLFHTGMMFSSWDWHVKNIETSEAFDQVMRWLHAWRMPLLFFISGSAVWFAMDRYTAGRFLIERQRRLLLPLLFGMLVVIPPQVYTERLYHHQGYASFLDFYPTIFTSGSYPQGNLSWHHLWYVPYIWAFSMLMFPVFLLVRSAAGRSVLARVLRWFERPWMAVLLFLPSAVAEIALRPMWPGDADNLINDWANFTHKLTFFVAGFMLASGTGVYDSLARHRRKFLLAAVASSAVVITIWNGRWHFFHLGMAGYHSLANFHVWMWLFVLLGYGRQYLSFNHKDLRYANEAVYPFYILHQTVIIILAYQLAYVNWGIPLKFVVVASATFAISWALYEFAIKPWNVLRVSFGMKWISRQPLLKSRPLETALPAATCLLLLAVALCGCGRHSSRSASGLIVCQTLLAPSLSTNIVGVSDRQEVVVYLPPSYADANRRFPVLYFLPNFKTDLWRYSGGTFQGFRLKDAMDRQIRLGVAREMIVVMPNAVHFLGGSWYRSSPLTGNWEDFITRDLVAFIDSHFRTVPSAEGRAIAGHGVGGLGALELGLKHAATFSTVYAMSPAVWDERGLQNMEPLPKQTARLWEGNLQRWQGLDEAARRKSFRDFINGRLNSPSREASMEGLFVSYGGAVSPDLSLPYPHISFPSANVPAGLQPVWPAQYELGMGGWKAKLQQYLQGAPRLRAITIEYGKNDEYEFIRRGADYVSGLMQTLGIPNQLTRHEGGHESTLGRRLETAMLPEVSRSLQNLP